MARRDDNLQARLDRDLTELKLLEIAKSYREVLDEAARKATSDLLIRGILIWSQVQLFRLTFDRVEESQVGAGIRELGRVQSGWPARGHRI